MVDSRSASVATKSAEIVADTKTAITRDVALKPSAGKTAPRQTASTVRTQKWTRAEKDRVLESLKSGRVSIVEVARCVGETKSLRQVAEYIEYMQLWSKLIDDMPLHKQELSPRLPAPEAQESDGGSSSDMDIDSSDDHGGNVCSRSLGKSIRMFDQEFGDLLAKMCTGDDDATVDKKSYLVLRNILTDFLSSVFKESIDNAAITNNVTKCKNSNSKFRVVLSEEVVNEALQMCGYSEYMRLEDSTTLMDRLIAEYVDDTVASELLAELDTLSAATSDSEDGISTGSDHE